MTRRSRNPAIARRDYETDPARLTPEHFSNRAVQQATKIGVRAVRGEGKLLGSGNFGETYAVGGLLVKLPTAKDIHGRVRSEKEQRDAFIHEVGVANELQDLGFRVAPRSIYVEPEGIPAIVREYGQIPARITPREYDALGDALYKVLEAGWVVADDLLVARRPDRSLFVADVGVWRPQRPGKGFHSDRENAPEDLTYLLRRFSGEQPWIDPLIPDKDRAGIAKGYRPTADWGIPTAREMRDEVRKSMRNLHETKQEDRDFGGKENVMHKWAMQAAEKTKAWVEEQMRRRALVGL